MKRRVLYYKIRHLEETLKHERNKKERQQLETTRKAKGKALH
jgi:hypothetical protein